jgi:hypothetical protein
VYTNFEQPTKREEEPTQPHNPLNTSSELSERQVSANVVVKAVVFDLVGARSADIGVIISAVRASQRVKVRQLLYE